MQPACPHEQSMSGVFSIASHWVLQYLPDVVTHEQTGCAHFSAFAFAIFFSPISGQKATDPKPHLSPREQAVLSNKGHTSSCDAEVSTKNVCDLIVIGFIAGWLSRQK